MPSPSIAKRGFAGKYGIIANVCPNLRNREPPEDINSLMK